MKPTGLPWGGGGNMFLFFKRKELRVLELAADVAMI